MDANSLLRDQVRQAHLFLEGTLDDVTPEQAHWQPEGKANSLGSTYAHMVTGEDGFIHAFLKGGAPLFATSWAGKEGLSEPPPPDREWEQWGHRLQVDLPALRQYAQAVYAATDEYLASLSEADLTRPLDLSDVGLGQQTLAWVISNGITGHVMSHWGEIACLKGLQGGRGFPV